MDSEACVICFKHCCSRAIFCKQVPDDCPLCNSAIADYELEPFRLPYPFTKAKESPVTVVIRPSIGNFLNDYNVTDDLHIGIVDSEGFVWEFDTPGLIKDDFLNWENCLAFKIVPQSWTDHWDQILRRTCNNRKWSSINYREDTLNCFDFVLEFLKALKFEDLVFFSKEEFCQQFIIPKIQDALKFITIYRKLRDADYFVAS
ncbi:MKRN2 opposite strand protein [Athalia rosae]|uniref:MKRN2 opposite strand protein n=1 Tax=Athalia rosae TaxID=37344 RepID=UPI00203378D7|nr:MKRN2 opposite strand protein [Athalia rosae]